MTDIVKRLRKVECVERELAHDCDMPPEGTANWEYAETCKEAANEIERLRADQREADEEFSLLQNDLGQALIEIENLRLALEVAANDLEDWGAYTKAKNARAALEGE